ncbi:MAG: hypothetical protein H0X24_00940 [Ktedonobacterales bacterium]|nr:hypothetical protein [Ktedonobacterales bacterium]
MFIIVLVVVHQAHHNLRNNGTIRSSHEIASLLLIVRGLFRRTLALLLLDETLGTPAARCVGLANHVTAGAHEMPTFQPLFAHRDAGSCNLHRLDADDPAERVPVRLSRSLPTFAPTIPLPRFFVDTSHPLPLLGLSPANIS